MVACLGWNVKRHVISQADCMAILSCSCGMTAVISPLRFGPSHLISQVIDTIVTKSARSTSKTLRDDLGSRHLTRRAHVDPTDTLYAREGFVVILQLKLLDLPIDADRLVVAGESHVSLVVANHCTACFITVVVQLHVVQISALRQHAVGVRVACKVVDAVQYTLVKNKAPLRFAAVVSRGQITDGAVDNLADVVSQSRYDWVQVEGVQNVPNPSSNESQQALNKLQWARRIPREMGDLHLNDIL